MLLHGPRRLLFFTLVLGIVCSLNDTACRAADLQLKPDNSLESRALELLSARRGRITAARVTAASANALTVAISYSGLAANDLILTVRAVDRRRTPLRGVSEGQAPLNATEGETEVRLERSGAREGEISEQRYLFVQIGPRRGRKDCVQTFSYPFQWGEEGGRPIGDGGEVGGVVNVVAEPVGRSASLPVQRPLTRLRTLPVLLKNVPATSGTSKGAKVREVTGSLVLPPPRPMRPVRPRPVRPRPGILDPVPGVIVGIPEDVKQGEGKGPGPGGLSLYDIATDVNIAPEEILSLHPVIFEDANPQSGFFYYMPRGYHLDWNEDEGYAFRILYGAAAGEGANPNTVYISARLTAGISSGDLALAEKLAERYFKGKFPQRKFGGLKPFPISGMKPELNGEAYNIPKEKLVVTGSMDLSGEIDLSFTTDPVTKENLQAVLTQGLGLTGTVNLLSDADAGGGKLEASVPLSIRLADQDSFGSRPFTRNQPFRNPSPYPARLKYLHVLMEENPARIYSYSLGNRIAPARGSARIDARQVREWLDTAGLKLWVEYSITGDDATNRKVMDQVTGGVSNVAQSEVTFRTLTPLADTGAALVLVTISSRYLDPKAETEKLATLELNKDNETFKLKPIYLVGRQAEEEKPNDPLFKYRLTIVKPDGTTKEGKEWIASSKMTIFIGAAQIKPILEGN